MKRWLMRFFLAKEYAAYQRRAWNQDHVCYDFNAWYDRRGK